MSLGIAAEAWCPIEHLHGIRDRGEFQGHQLDALKLEGTLHTSVSSIVANVVQPQALHPVVGHGHRTFDGPELRRKDVRTLGLQGVEESDVVVRLVVEGQDQRYFQQAMMQVRHDGPQGQHVVSGRHLELRRDERRHHLERKDAVGGGARDIARDYQAEQSVELQDAAGSGGAFSGHAGESTRVAHVRQEVRRQLVMPGLPDSQALSKRLAWTERFLDSVPTAQSACFHPCSRQADHVGAIGGVQLPQEHRGLRRQGESGRVLLHLVVQPQAGLLLHGLINRLEGALPHHAHQRLSDALKLLQRQPAVEHAQDRPGEVCFHFLSFSGQPAQPLGVIYGSDFLQHPGLLCVTLPLAVSRWPLAVGRWPMTDGSMAPALRWLSRPY